MAGQQAAGADTRSLWFNQPDERMSGRLLLSRERVVAEALAVISAEGAQALSMRAIAARLGVVPGALYRHVRSKEQLYDLVLDAVLAEAACQAGSRRALGRAGRLPRSAACGRYWRTTPASPPCSRPATRSAPHRWRSPRHSSRRSARPG